MEIVEWCRKNDIWYLKMDLGIPKVCIKEAQQIYDEGFFVPHRSSDGDGWWSSALHGFVPKGERISMGWHHTKNPSGHGFSEEDQRIVILDVMILKRNYPLRTALDFGLIMESLMKH